jgi:hypothetical protein
MFLYETSHGVVQSLKLQRGRNVTSPLTSRPETQDIYQGATHWVTS